MNDDYKKPLRDIGAKIEDFMTRYCPESQKGPIESAFGMALKSDDFEKLFNEIASDAQRQAFTEICRAVYGLASEYTTLIASGLSGAGFGENEFKRWADGDDPSKVVQPEIIKVFRLHLSLILNENSEDREFLRFHDMAQLFFCAVLKAQDGARWDNHMAAKEPIQAYNDEALEWPAKIREQFARLDSVIFV